MGINNIVFDKERCVKGDNIFLVGRHLLKFRSAMKLSESINQMKMC